MDRWLVNARRADGTLVDLHVLDAVIAAVEPAGSRPHPGGLDLQGRTVVPGLWDAHVHFGQWAMWSRYIPAGHVRAVAQLARLAASSPRTQAGVLAGGRILAGARPALMERLPTKADLAQVDGPVVVISSDAHSVLANDEALARLGFAAHPTGFLTEHDSFAVLADLARIDPLTLDTWVGEAAQAAAARGVVGIVDLEFGWNLTDWLRRESAGQQSLRVEAGFYPEQLDQARGYTSGQAVTDLVRVGPLKIISDGAIGSLTAWTSQPYPDGSHGQANYSATQLAELVGTAARGGIATTMHAIGDEANRVALDTFAQVGVPGTIEHAQQVSPADVPRFAALQVTASVQPEHAMDDRALVHTYWPQAAANAYRLRSLVAAGAHLTFGSDAPVTPLDPWFAIASAVTRTREPELGPWQAHEALHIDQALAASVRTQIAPGQPADLVILEDELSPQHLRTMPIAATMLAGRLTYDGARLPW